MIEDELLDKTTEVQKEIEEIVERIRARQELLSKTIEDEINKANEEPSVVVGALVLSMEKYIAEAYEIDPDKALTLGISSYESYGAMLGELLGELDDMEEFLDEQSEG
jgi:hypothetical protein